MSTGKKVILITSSTVLLLFVGFFLLRNTILQNLINKKLSSFNENRKAEVSIGKATFSGFKTIMLENVLAKGIESDTLFYGEDVKVSIRLLSLLKGNYRPSEIGIINSKIKILKDDTLANYGFLLKKEKAKNEESERDLGKVFNRAFDLLFDIIPSKLIISNSTLFLQKDSISLLTIIKEIRIENEKISANVQTNESGAVHSWDAVGIINKDDEKVQFSIIPLKGKIQQLPLVKKEYNLQVGFDTIRFTLAKDYQNQETILTGESSVTGFSAHHWRISPNVVTIPQGKLNYKFKITKDRFILDSTSTLSVNKIPVSAYFNFKPGIGKELETKISFSDVPSNDFFSSLPEGLFESLKGIKATGKLSYNMYLNLPFANPDSVKFNSTLRKKVFKIRSFGNTVFTEVNGSFSHTVYEKEKPVRTFIVGPANPSFTPIEQISEYLRATVLTSEDGSFYYHNGFNEEAFRKSLATNIKEKRFVRGGSTISMQLVKNLFLTRTKTISRKVEEALIVWLIENNRLVSKQRMFEIYLNIIEWGPGVYGIGEASQFYFKKHPSQLNLEESIFLAMIVPRPKAFKYHFDETGNLKPHVIGYFNLISHHLIKRGFMTEEEKLMLTYNVNLQGPARNYFNMDVVEEEEEF